MTRSSIEPLGLSYGPHNAWDDLLDKADIGFGDELNQYNPPSTTNPPQAMSAREYVATSTGDGTDEFSVQKLVIERIPIYPVRQGVARGMPQDTGTRNGTLRNRLDLESPVYGYDSPDTDLSGNRIYGLTVVNAGPPYSNVIQHVMQENAEMFSVHDAQTEPWAYDTAATLPYVQPMNPKETPVDIAPEYEQLL